MRLTRLEIEALLSVAGEADSHAACEEFGRLQEKMHKAFERGMEKLRARLAELESTSTNKET
jgi:hypothetical protein